MLGEARGVNRYLSAGSELFGSDGYLIDGRPRNDMRCFSGRGTLVARHPLLSAACSARMVCKELFSWKHFVPWLSECAKRKPALK